MDHTFKEITAEQWRALIEKELRGKSYEELLWPLAEGVTGQPDYSAEQAPNPITFVPHQDKPEPWLMAETIVFSTPDEANKLALESLNHGANALIFEGPIHRTEDLEVLLNEIGLPYIGAFFKVTNGYNSFIPSFQEYIKSQQYPAEKIRGGLDFDPIGTLLRRGNWINNEIRDRELFAQIMSQSEEMPLKNFCAVQIDGSIYHNSGADAATELACVLAHGNEYLNWHAENGGNAIHAAADFHFKFAVGRKYFSQIAKLRAFRPLWANVCEAYGMDAQVAGKALITGETSRRERSIRDAHTNLLRNTTQAMSAVIGGCDCLSVLPFDTDVQRPNGFSQRMSRNLQLILSEEAGLGYVSDVANGAYLFDRMSHDMMESAWKIFQAIEAQGGLVESVKSGWLQERISKTALEESRKIETKESVYLGANKYPNPKELASNVEVEEPVSGESTLIDPLPLRRAAEHIEHTEPSTPS